jgi:hypothetical protein
MVKPVEPIQGMLDFGENPEKPQRGKAGPSKFDEVMDRVKKENAEKEYFKDQRTPKSPLVAEAELARMKEILNKPKAGGGTGGGMGMPKMNRDITKNYKAGGKVSSASKRADGCAVKGKTKGRIV